MDIKLTTLTKILLSVIALACTLFWLGLRLLGEFGRAMGSTGGGNPEPWVELEFRIIYFLIFFTIVSLLLGFLLKWKYSSLLFLLPFVFLAVGLVSNYIIGKKLISEYVRISDQTKQAGRLLLDEELNLFPKDFRLIDENDIKFSSYFIDYVSINAETGDLRRVRVSTGGNNREKYILEISTLGRLTGNKIEFFDELWVEEFPKTYVAISKNVSNKRFKNVFLKGQTGNYIEKVF